SGRYVSRTRVKKMLTHEFNLLTERLHGEKYKSKTFFAFANTVTTLNFTKTNDRLPTVMAVPSAKAVMLAVPIFSLVSVKTNCPAASEVPVNADVTTSARPVTV